jgi:poly[(R)-3-hydroxyalkanoate] polymerase subunit PhaC
MSEVKTVSRRKTAPLKRTKSEKRICESCAQTAPSSKHLLPPSDMAGGNSSWPRDSYASTAVAEILDRATHAAMGRVTAGLSPGALMAAYLDWITHLAHSPGKQLQLAQKAQKKVARFGNYAMRNGLRREVCECCINPLPQDRRFDGEAWRQWPFNLMSQSFLLTQQWWHNATTGVRGVTPQHERLVEFAARQILDVFSPSNFILTNPEVLQETVMTGGANLFRGWQNFLEDYERAASGKPPVGADAFKVGENVAVTPGHVVYRNRLIELIQYKPTTKQVNAEPILIVPAWIMKYYILDLSPENSLVKYLVDKGHTVFMISWKNPGPEDRDLGFDDYRMLGVMEALDAIGEIAPDVRIHAVGYCLGGTLLGIAAAVMAAAGDDRLKTLTFLASQFDFTEAGELSIFINESQVTFLEDIMWEQGFLDAKQMAGAFQILHSQDLIWSRVEHNYLMGERQPMFDLMAWNADATRMPYKMHSEYLRQLFLNNDLAEGRYRVEGRSIALSDIRTPIFSVATTRDHVTPWRSAFKVHLLADAEVTFLLTNGGHNAGIVSEPGHLGRKYRIRMKKHNDNFVDPDMWCAETDETDGSWWPAWDKWIDEHSSGKVDPPKAKWVKKDVNEGAPHSGKMTPAPGAYVLMA